MVILGANDEMTSEYAFAEMVPKERMQRPGHINYIGSLFIEKVYGKELCYADHNEVVEVLNSIALKFYRRKIAPYEDVKNGEEGNLTDRWEAWAIKSLGGWVSRIREPHALELFSY